MTVEERAQVQSLRRDGLGYKRISYITGVPFETVKAYIRRHPADDDEMPHIVPAKIVEVKYLPCRQCGEPVAQNPGRKQKKFCCIRCRNNWWNRNKYKIDHPSSNLFQCAGCGCEFRAYGTTKRKYCSHSCYIKDRFGQVELPDVNS